MTTGSTVNGLVNGMGGTFKGHGGEIMGVLGNPDGVVTPLEATSAISGGTIAYDQTNNQYYQNTTGSTWQKLGSVA